MRAEPRSDALSVQDVAALYTVFGDRVVEAVLVDDEAYTAAWVEHPGLPEAAGVGGSAIVVVVALNGPSPDGPIGPRG